LETNRSFLVHFRFHYFGVDIAGLSSASYRITSGIALPVLQEEQSLDFDWMRAGNGGNLGAGGNCGVCFAADYRPAFGPNIDPPWSDWICDRQREGLCRPGFHQDMESSHFRSDSL